MEANIKSKSYTGGFMKKKLLITFLTVCAGLVQADVEQLVIPIAASEQMPVVDGRMIRGEWCRALKVTGLVELFGGSVAYRQSEINFIADPNYLYIGIKCPQVPLNTVPESLADGEKEMSKLISSNIDRFEINLAISDQGLRHYFIVDAKGNKYCEEIGTISTRKDIPWEYKSSYDTKYWYAELRIKAADLGIAKFTDGMKAGLNVSRVWAFPYSYTGLVRRPHELVKVTFLKGAPAFQIDGFGNIRDGKLKLDCSVREYEGDTFVPREMAYDENASGKAGSRTSGNRLHLKLETLEKNGQIQNQKNAECNMIPGKVLPLSIRETFSTIKPQHIRITATQNDKMILYSAVLPVFSLPSDFQKSLQERLRKGTVSGSWRLTSAFFPYWEKARIRFTNFSEKIAKEGDSVLIRIHSPNGYDQSKSSPLNGMSPVEIEFSIPGLPEGVYTVECSIVDRNKKVLDKKNDTYTRKKFVWEHNNIGKSRIVLKPWTPVKVKNTSVSVWERTFRISGTGLPESIIVRGKEILSSPVAFSAKVNGQNETLRTRPISFPEFTENNPDLVRWNGQGNIGSSLNVKINGRAEFDGFTYYRVTFIPTGTISLDSLQLDIELPDDIASLMHMQGQGARANFSGAIPSGRGVVYDGLHQKGTSHMTGAFIPHIWLGNPERGLSYFADSNENFRSLPNKAVNEIIRRDGKVICRVNIVSTPVKLDKPFSIEFGLIPTPVKPLLPHKDIVTRAVNWLSYDNKRIFQEAMYAPIPKDFDYKQATEELNKWPNKDGVRLYFNKHELPYCLPEVAVFDYEWGGMDPESRYTCAINRFSKEKSEAINRYLTASRIDMFVYYIAEMVRKTPMKGTYWDITGIYAAHPMQENGSSYIAPNGNVIQKWNILASRELFKRVATLFQEIRQEPDYMEIHSTNHIGIPFYSFASDLLNFEWRWLSKSMTDPDGYQHDYIDLRPLDVLAAEGTPEQFGIRINAITPTGEDRLANPEDMETFRRILRSARITASLHNHSDNRICSLGDIGSVDFIGYWDEAGRIRTNTPLAQSVIYRKGNILELVVANLARRTQKVEVTVDLKKLGAWNMEIIENTNEIEGVEISRKYQTKQKIKAQKMETAMKNAEYFRKQNPYEAKCENGKLQLRVPIQFHDYRSFKLKLVK